VTVRRVLVRDPFAALPELPAPGGAILGGRCAWIGRRAGAAGGWRFAERAPL
jgi:hypothetical protein